MAIKNYSSGTSPAKSLGMIQELLAENGAQHVSMEYSNGKPVALTFVMQVGPNTIPFRLTVDVSGMLQAMKDDKKVARSYCTTDQAERTAWKNKYEWIHLQMAEISTGQARIEQLLLGYAVTPQGDTVFEMLTENKLLLEETYDG